MLLDAEDATELTSRSNARDRAIVAFLRWIEGKLDVSIVRNVRDKRYLARLETPIDFATRLLENGIITTFGRTPSLADEPRTYSWYVECNNAMKHVTGGTSWSSDSDALYASLAEALERFIWLTQDDYFVKPVQGTAEKVAASFPIIPPPRWVGYSASQRKIQSQRELTDSDEYQWIQAESLVRHSSVHVPAQLISGRHQRTSETGQGEKVIRTIVSTGLATWHSRTGARLAGLHEIIERDAYMILWLNQLTLPRIELSALSEKDAELKDALKSCARYRLRVHAVRMITDAPTFAIAVILEDMSGHGPRITIGLRSHRTLSSAILKAMTEALRARRAIRNWEKKGNVWDDTIPVAHIGHRDRLYYWNVPENAKRLEFLIQGEEREHTSEAWEHDSEQAHFERLIAWCKEMQYECISVPLTHSKKNISKWHIEMVAIPELQPTYLTESDRAFAGTRIIDIPKKFGYSPRVKPFIDAPHPFS